MIIKVAAAQVQLDFCRQEEEYLRKFESFVKSAKEKGASLIAFPEDSGTPLLGLYRKPLKVIKEYARPGEGWKNLIIRLIKLPLVAKTFAIMGPLSRRIFEETFSYLAQKYDIYLMAGTILLPDENNNVYNIAYFYDRQGNLLGCQKKIHLYRTEVVWGLSRGEEINIFSTEIGKIGIAICMDNGYPEVARIMRIKGADIIIDPSVNPDYYNHYAAINGLWARCQENYVFGIHSCMVGDVLGKIVIRGKAKILAPWEITPNQDGFLAEAKTDDDEELLISELNFEKLHNLRKEFDLVRNINVNFLKKNFACYEKIEPQIKKTNIWNMLFGLTYKR